MGELARKSLRFIRWNSEGEDADSDFQSEVVSGLSSARKTLPCRFLYDSRGSELFEEITRLPEYYLTSTEQGILEARGHEIVDAIGGNFALVEFGSGSSCKTRILIDAALDRQKTLQYLPIDISTEFLRSSADALIADYPNLEVVAVAAEYTDAIRALPPSDQPRMILFLGSNIGNFQHDEAVGFLSLIAREMEDCDRILIGVDLLKDPAILTAAYNDSRGVTAEFNKNILRRINNELGGDFDLDAFAHFAPFVPEKSRVEMHLVSQMDQTVHLAAAGQTYVFEHGESIHTECSHKYTCEVFERLAADAGLEIQNVWTDERNWFSLFLLKRNAHGG